MKETLSIESNGGPIEIIGGKYDSALLLNGVPIQFTFLREIGSTWRYQIAKSISESDIIQDKSFTNFAKFGQLTNEPLSIQFKYILDKLSKGKYEIEITSLPADTGLCEGDDSSTDYKHYDMYGGLMDIIETQSSYNEQTIVDYMDLIDKGTRPIMIVIKTKGSDNIFILDGHHKFVAYSQMKIDAVVLEITKLDSSKIDKKLGLELFDKCGSKNANYISRFLERV